MKKTHMTILHRVRILYVLFFVITAASVVSGTLSRGIFVSLRDTERLKTDIKDCDDSDFFYDIVLDADYDDFNIPIASDSTMVITARPVSLDLKILSDIDHKYVGNIWSFILNYAGIAVVVATYLLLLSMLISLGRSIKNKACFSPRNIHRVRWVGILLILYSILNSLYYWVDNNTVAHLFENSAYAVDTAFHFDYFLILMGIVILFIGEIFAVGSELSEDQKLTI